jgi:hypothetical protein
LGSDQLQNNPQRRSLRKRGRGLRNREYVFRMPCCLAVPDRGGGVPVSGKPVSRPVR